ncbi:MAG: hypothetical protein JXQ29_16660 [Planctomycetes bacterium]|nr:hypothetical protein [Planctomycetota bacterium]
MPRCLLALVLAGLALSGPVLAQTEGVALAPEAVRGLIRRGLDEVAREWVERAASDPALADEAGWLALARDLYTIRWYREAARLLEALAASQGPVGPAVLRGATPRALTRYYLARCWIWLGRYAEAEALVRAWFEARKRDLAANVDLAELLTGTVRELDGAFYYLPGLGHDRDRAREGWKLWNRLRRSGDFADYLRGTFHQVLVHWAQGRPDRATTVIKVLREAVGRPDATWGPWEQKFRWLQEQLDGGIAASRDPPAPPPPLVTAEARQWLGSAETQRVPAPGSDRSGAGPGVQEDSPGIYGLGGGTARERYQPHFFSDVSEEEAAAKRAPPVALPDAVTSDEDTALDRYLASPRVIVDVVWNRNERRGWLFARVEAEGRGPGARGVEAAVLTVREFPAWITPLARSRRAAGTGVSTVSVFVRCDRATPFEAVYCVLRACAAEESRIVRINLATRAGAGTKAEARLAVLLPEGEPPGDRISVALAVEGQRTSCRVNGQDLGTLPDDLRRIEAALVRLQEVSRVARRVPAGRAHIIFPPSVSHQAVVTLLDACRRAGIPWFTFACVE